MMKLNDLVDVVSNAAAVRRVLRLQPVGGLGDKIFPPTYLGEGRNAPARHAFEKRRVGGETVTCVLMDSVQSQANRLEESLLEAQKAGRIELPMIVVDFSRSKDIGDIGFISSLEAPHRVFDAIIRDSEMDGTKFPQTEFGRKLQTAKPCNSSDLFDLSPNALLFGVWNSTGEGGGLGAKFARCIVSEIVGVNVAMEGSQPDRPSGIRTGSRIDPLGASKSVRIAGSRDDWKVAGVDDEQSSDGKKPSKGYKRPSEINHGNIAPSIGNFGVTVDYAQQTTVISMAGLRRLIFPDANGKRNGKRDVAARSTLAALGLVAIKEQDCQGYALRSRCDLVPESKDQGSFEIVHADGETTQFDMKLDDAVNLYKESVEICKSSGFRWSNDPLTLRPQKQLVELVKLSRQQALAGKGTVDGDDSN